MLDYMEWRGDLSFKVSPFNDVDAMILSQLAGVDYTGIVDKAVNVDLLNPKEMKRVTLREVAKQYKMVLAEPNRKVDFEESDNKKLLLDAVGNSVRFGDIEMSAFIRDTDVEAVKQFSAVTFFLPRRVRFIAFRGTDGSVTSWKENFNMAYLLPFPAERDALVYLEKMSKGFFVKTIIGGHSKGGNLALYSGYFSDEKTRKKIKKVYCFDGPGFCEDPETFPGYEDIKEKIVAYIPQSSVVGRILNAEQPAMIVKSNGLGIGTHSMFTWQITGTTFVAENTTDEYSNKTKELLDNWISQVERKERKALIEEVFAVLGKNDIHNAEDFAGLGVKQLPKFIMDVLSLSQPNKELLLSIIKESFSPELLKGFLHLPEFHILSRRQPRQDTEECEDEDRS